MYILGEGKKTQKKAITRSNTELQASTKKRSNTKLHIEIFPVLRGQLTCNICRNVKS